MKILAIESSATAASCCICDDGRLLAQSFQNNGLTHSRTLLPMITAMLDNCGLTLKDMDRLAVAVGPGSFTGLRIGIATAKGLAWPEDKPLQGVSTLEAMARNLGTDSGILCCAMDARRKQVYNALFRAEQGRLTRLTPDRAIGLQQLFQELSALEQPVTLVGDGALLCRDFAQSVGCPVRLAPENLRHQSAWGVALAALEQEGNLSAGDLVPNYLRLSQAERERMEKAAGQPVNTTI